MNELEILSLLKFELIFLEFICLEKKYNIIFIGEKIEDMEFG